MDEPIYDPQDQTEKQFSELSNLAFVHAISLEYEGSSGIDYEEFLVNKVIELGDIDEVTLTNLKLNSNTIYTDLSGEEHSERVAHYAEAFYSSLSDEERKILDSDLDEEDTGISFKEMEPDFSESLFENEVGMNKFTKMMQKDLDRMLLISLLTGKESKLEIYKDEAGKYYIDTFPRVRGYDGAWADSEEGLNSVFAVHTHPRLENYDVKSKRFLSVDGFSYNPCVGEIEEYEYEDRSDWFNFLAEDCSGVEAILSSNGDLTIVRINGIDIEKVINRGEAMNMRFGREELEFLKQGGIYTDIIVRNVLTEIVGNQYLEEVDEKIATVLGFDLYKGTTRGVAKLR